jgi:hypothetical protein
MGVDDLLDLTNEPLLAYLLILSGYVTDRWREAAENRNRIYQAIFDQIWIREKKKPTRIHLNDLGKEGFESLLQALGMAAWRGGGRTGDKETFMSIRDIFMRPDLLARAEACGAADLSNVALLFYTRKDEGGGRGYEFLHKSFGEYLTARGLFRAFVRWGKQAVDPQSDFSPTEFLRRWLLLTGPAPLTREILAFLRNEARLASAAVRIERPWEEARKLVSVAEKLFDAAAREGLPARELGIQWRAAELQERNGEETLFGLVDALGRAAYPGELLGKESADGGWQAGPIKIAEFDKAGSFCCFARRMSYAQVGWLASKSFFAIMPSTPIFTMFSRLDLHDAELAGLQLSDADFSGANLANASLTACCIAHSSFIGADLSSASLDYSSFQNVDFAKADVTHADFSSANLDTESSASLASAGGQKSGNKRMRTARLRAPSVR